MLASYVTFGTGLETESLHVLYALLVHALLTFTPFAVRFALPVYLALVLDGTRVVGDAC